jgi:hypothetical protein
MNKVWTDGRHVRVGATARTGEREADPRWVSSLAAVMRHIDATQEVTHADLVALRRRCVTAGGEGVNPAHVAIAMLIQLQAGQTADRLLMIDAVAWHELTKAFDLQV